MTPEDFAAEHGLTLEEAHIILRRRKAAEAGAETVWGRLARAKEALSKAQKKVGVHPVQEGFFDDLQKVHDPDAEEGLDRFYKKGISRNVSEQARMEEGYPYSDDGGADE